jgi:hypothetical protein
MADIIHRKRLFDGRPAAEVYAETAWPGKVCTGCGGKPPAIRVQIFVALQDMSAQLREVALYEIALRRLNTVRTKRGPAIRTGEAYACRLCQASLERTAARAPSYAMVDLERGPGPETPIVGVISDVQ